ncbi:MAG: hypothetical protein QM710_13860 [Flavobacterium sp.]
MRTLLLPAYEDGISIIFEKSDALGNIFGIKLFNTYDEKANYLEYSNENSLSILEYVKMLNDKRPVKNITFPFTKTQIENGMNWRNVITRFMTDLGNRGLQTIPLKSLENDYTEGLIDYGNSMEMLTAVFCNTLRMDKDYKVINEEWARYRASQYIRLFNDTSYKEKPAFKAWETMLWV